MSFGKVLAFGVIALGAYQGWNRYSEQSALKAATDERGFVTLQAPDNAQQNVMVVAAENCPKEESQRADELTRQLRHQHIPVDRVHNVQFSAISDPSMVGRLNSVMTGPLPIVFIGDKAKANPSLEEVMAGYQAARAQR